MLPALALLPAAAAAAAPPLPSAPVLQWQLHDTGCFVHYNMATMAGSQGCQSGVAAPPPLSAWQPTALDTDAWMDTCKAMGGTRIIYVAKHGCGFAAWKSKVSAYNYSVANIDGGVDVVAAFVQSARAAGLGVGFYYSDATNSYCNVRGGVVVSLPSPLSTRSFACCLSRLLSALAALPQVPGGGKPGQMLVTQQQYDAFVVAHLTELWTDYGALDEIWFDVSALTNSLPLFCFVLGCNPQSR